MVCDITAYPICDWALLLLCTHMCVLQAWHWAEHGAVMTDTGARVTKDMVKSLVTERGAVLQVSHTMHQSLEGLAYPWQRGLVWTFCSKNSELP